MTVLPNSARAFAASEFSRYRWSQAFFAACRKPRGTGACLVRLDRDTDGPSFDETTSAAAGPKACALCVVAVLDPRQAFRFEMGR